MASQILNIPPPPYSRDITDDAWIEWLRAVYPRLQPGPFQLPGYAVANVPPANVWGDGTDFTSLIMVSNETGGLTLAFSDGTNWRRVQDRAIIA